MDPSTLRVTTVNRVTFAVAPEEVYGVTQKSERSSLMYIPLRLPGGKRIQGLHDSGATASLISEAAVKKLQLCHLVTGSNSHRLAGAFRGNSVASCGEISLSFYIKKKPYVHTFIVADLSRGNQIILGQDFWYSHNSQLRTGDGDVQLILEGEEVYRMPSRAELQSRSHMVGSVTPVLTDHEATVYRTCVLPARFEQIVKLRLPDSTPKGKY